MVEVHRRIMLFRALPTLRCYGAFKKKWKLKNLSLISNLRISSSRKIQKYIRLIFTLSVSGLRTFSFCALCHLVVRCTAPPTAPFIKSLRRPSQTSCAQFVQSFVFQTFFVHVISWKRTKSYGYTTQLSFNFHSIYSKIILLNFFGSKMLHYLLISYSCSTNELASSLIYAAI